MFEWIRTPSGAYWLTLGLAVVGWLIAGVGIFAGFHYYRIKAADAERQTREAEEARANLAQELSETKGDLAAAEKEASRASAELQYIRTPRSLSVEQEKLLKGLLSAGPKGKVTVTFLSVEGDAEHYAKQIGKTLSDAGFDVTMSGHLWLQLALDGLFLCVREAGSVPPHGSFIQHAFKTAGIRLKGHYDAQLCDKLNVPKDGVVLAVSNKDPYEEAEIRALSPSSGQDSRRQ